MLGQLLNEYVGLLIGSFFVGFGFGWLFQTVRRAFESI